MSSLKSDFMDENLEPSRKILKRMGYFRDHAGILNRYFREEGNWYSHSDNCHSFILQEIKAAKPKNVLVLGSGWLLDFPIDSDELRKVNITLADVFHPRQIKHKISKLDTFKLLAVVLQGV